jgi:stage III sporulation protein AG
MNKEKIIDFLKKTIGAKKLVIIGIIGIALIGLSSFVPSKNQTKGELITSEISAEEYKAELEKQIKEIAVSISGDKKAKVIITLETSIRREYAGESQNQTDEKSTDKGKETSGNVKEKAITVKKSDGSEEALIITEYMPQIRGVAIVCNTGGSEAVKTAIRDAVTAALGITTKRVYIGGHSG